MSIQDYYVTALLLEQGIAGMSTVQGMGMQPSGGNGGYQAQASNTVKTPQSQVPLEQRVAAISKQYKTMSADPNLQKAMGNLEGWVTYIEGMVNKSKTAQIPGQQQQQPLQ